MILKLFFYLLILLSTLNSSILHFKKYILQGSKKGDTLLVIGGIHGNEPGGYFAPAILIKHYKIKKGRVIVVPNLNFDSDIRNVRGLYGDMNRKFAKISKSDPDYKIVQNIKKIILDKDVDLILNLHDGHGFYRKKWENIIFNPKAWGQALIIDQVKIKDPKYGDLDKICKNITNKINNSLFKKKHVFGIKNTNTKFQDEQMRLSLTYFAITHNKPALAIETSKNIVDLDKKVYYQLLAIEEFMHIMGIEFERDFKLDIKHIDNVIKKYGRVFINNRVNINLAKVNSFINHLPLKRGKNLFDFTHPLGAVIKNRKYFQIKVGNKLITTIKADYFKYSDKKPKIIIKTDGKTVDASNIFEVKVKKSFTIKTAKDIRVNVIGFTSKKYKNEANIKIDIKKIDKRYSIYKNQQAYRAEFYDNKNRYIKTIIIETNE